MEKLYQVLTFSVRKYKNYFISKRYTTISTYLHNLSKNKRKRKSSKVTNKSKMSVDTEFVRSWTKERHLGHVTQLKNSYPFTVMSYNILAQDLIDIHPYYYSTHDPSALDWKNRFISLLDEIRTINPDILCLQEVQESHLTEIADQFKTFYLDEFIYKKRTGSDQTDGCAIFFNSKMFKLIEKQTIEYFQPFVEVLDRKNVAIIAKFLINGCENSSIIVATTHLLYNPKRQDVRLAQIQVLLAELDRMAMVGYKDGRLNYLPIILTGDFNLQPNSAPYKLLTQGQLTYNNLSRRRLEEAYDPYELNGDQLIPKELGITDNCQHLETETRLYHSERLQNQQTSLSVKDYTDYPFQTGTLRHKLHLFSICNDFNYTSTFQNRWILVDYIFYSKIYNSKSNSYVENNLKLIKYYELPDRENCQTVGLIPNKKLGSDHLSLAAKFLYTSS